MKKIFALAMAIVSMAAVMTSCSDDNADFIEQKAPVAQQEVKQVRQTTDMTLMVAVTNDQMNYLDETYVVEIDGNRREVKVADMTPATAKQISAFEKAKDLAENFESTAKFYVCNLGNFEAGQRVKIVDHKIELKDNNQNEEFDYILASCFIAGNKLASDDLNCRLFRGVYSNDSSLEEFINVLGDYEEPIAVRF